MKETIMAIIKEPGKPAEVKEIPNTLEKLQEIVGGYIQMIQFDRESALICDEEGKLKGYEVNFPLWNDVIVGTCVIAGVDGEDLTDVPEQTIRTLSAICEEAGA